MVTSINSEGFCLPAAGRSNHYCKIYLTDDLSSSILANEHEPIHVHGKSRGREMRAELILVNGIVTEIRYAEMMGRAPLEPAEKRYFEEIVNARANEIVAKWIDFFVLHKSVKPEYITRRLK